MSVGTLEEIIDDNHAIVSSAVGPEYYVSILSFVDKDELEPGCSVLLHHKSSFVVGVLGDDTDPLVSTMKLEKAPKESYADIGGLEEQIQEIKVCVHLASPPPRVVRPLACHPREVARASQHCADWPPSGPLFMITGSCRAAAHAPGVLRGDGDQAPEGRHPFRRPGDRCVSAALCLSRHSRSLQSYFRN